MEGNLKSKHSSRQLGHGVCVFRESVEDILNVSGQFAAAPEIL